MPFYVTAALAIAAAATTAYGAEQSANAQAQAAKYNANVAEQNAKLSTQNAEWTGAEGEQQTGLAGIKSQQTEGAIKTAQAANNVDINSGSALSVQKSQDQSGLLNQSNTRSNAARTAYGFEVQASQGVGQAQLDRFAASSDQTAGNIGAAGDLLKGAESVSANNGFGGGSDPTITPPAIAPDSTNSSNTNSFLGTSPSSNFSLWTNDVSSNNIFGGP